MESKHLTYFKVENFKRFDSLEVKDIGQFNLVVGDNNVGKTTLLEALLFDDEDYYQCLYNFWSSLLWRNIATKDVNFNYLVFFSRNKNIPIKFFYAIENEEKWLTVIAKSRLEITKDITEKDANPKLQLALNSSDPYFIEITTENRSDLLFIKNITNAVNYIPYIAFSVIYKDDLLDMFSRISIETEQLKQFENSLSVFIPNLDSVEINSVLVHQQSVIAIRERGKGLIPLAQYGDGTIKLFRCLLEIDACENKRLMIDEIDTGIHYSKLKTYLKSVVQSAKKKNVQIFATTHSKECLEYFKEALEELNYQDDGRMIRIVDTKTGIKSFTFNYEQFDQALIAASEIR